MVVHLRFGDQRDFGGARGAAAVHHLEHITVLEAFSTRSEGLDTVPGKRFRAAEVRGTDFSKCYFFTQNCGLDTTKKLLDG